VPLSVLIVLGLFGIYLILRGRTREQEAGSPSLDGDARTLDELARAGSNFSLPHKIEFFLFLPTREAAEEVAGELRREGFSVEVAQGDHPADWLCLATRQMLPELAALHGWRQRLTAMAESRQGVYDGWGTEVEDQ
jgi:regulator of RNase E activity RraB